MSDTCGNCGHPAADHAEGYVCTTKLDTFPDGGFHGVCPCVRTDVRYDGADLALAMSEEEN